VESNHELVKSLVTLMGDEDGEVVASARKKLLRMGSSVIPALREHIADRPIHVKLRVKQVINWLKTDPLNRHLPPARKLQ
jgi:hypothetical protein